MWRYENDNGMSSAYPSLHIDSSRNSLGYPDFPVPSHKPDFLSHGEILAHLKAYCDRFGVRPHIRFHTEVGRVRPLAPNGWEVTLATGEMRRYRAVIVANATCGTRAGRRFSAVSTARSSTRTSTAPPPRSKARTFWWSASAIRRSTSRSICRRANSVTLSSRRTAYIMPKYLLGIPADRWSAFFARKLRLPTRATRTIMAQLIKLTVGNQERFGIARPKHPIWREHATISQELLPYLGHGWIMIKPNIRELCGKEVVFEDGSTRAIDAIIYATGYKTTFPFSRSRHVRGEG